MEEAVEEEEEEEEGGGDSLAMATDVEKYSHSCVSGGSLRTTPSGEQKRCGTIWEERHTNQSRQTET